MAASQDLREIRTNGVRDHGKAASSGYMAGFERLFALLRDNPHAGQARPEFRQGNVRSLAYRPHTIFYRVAEDTVVIDRILHAARDITRSFRGDR